MHDQIPRFNRKIYRSPRDRFAAQTSRTPSVHGRHALYQDQYARPAAGRSLRILKPVLIVIAVVLIVQSFFQIPYLRIDQVSIEGLKYIPVDQVRTYIDAELRRRRLVIFRNSNYFLVAEQKMRQRLEERFFVEVIELSKSFPDTLKIRIRERISAFVVQTPEGYFSLSVDGTAFQDVERPQDEQLLIADERALRERRVPLSYLEDATSLAEDWQGTITSARLRAFHLNDDTDRLIVSTDKGFKVYFDPDKELRPQIARLSVFLQDRDFSVPGEYIDLRFDDTVYVR